MGAGNGAAAATGPSQAELAVIAGSVRPVVPGGDPGVQEEYSQLLPAPGSPAALVGQRFAKLTPAGKHAWLA